MNQLYENDLVYTQFGYGILISFGNKKDFIEIEDDQMDVQEQFQDDSIQKQKGDDYDEQIHDKTILNNKSNDNQLNNDNLENQDGLSQNKDIKDDQDKKDIDKQDGMNEKISNELNKDEFNNESNDNGIKKEENIMPNYQYQSDLIENLQQNEFQKFSDNQQSNENEFCDQNKKSEDNQQSDQIQRCDKSDQNLNINDNQQAKENQISDDNKNNDQISKQNPEDINEEDDGLPSKFKNEQLNDDQMNKQEVSNLILEKEKQLAKVIQQNQIPRKPLYKIKDYSDDKQLNIVSVKLHSGAIVHLSDTLVYKKIRISVKTFFGNRQVYYYNLSIQTTIQQLKSMVIESSKENQKIFYNMRLIYPMGSIKELSVMSQTLEMYNIPQNANLILLVQTTFFWDPNMKGEGIKISNNNLTANKHGESDYQSVLGNLQLSSGVTYWEIKIDFYVDEEDIFIGIARKSLDLYISPLQTNQFWGYLCLCAKKFGPNGEFEDYGYVAKANDIIGVLLEFKQGIGCLSFYKNGVRCGPAFNSLTGTFYPAVSMFYGEVQVTLDPKAPRPLN